MAKIATDDLLSAFKEMTLIELADFVKLFEETFGVTAAAPVAVAAAPAAGGAGGDSGSADQDEFDVISNCKAFAKNPSRPEEILFLRDSCFSRHMFLISHEVRFMGLSLSRWSN